MAVYTIGTPEADAIFARDAARIAQHRAEATYADNILLGALADERVRRAEVKARRDARLDLTAQHALAIDEVERARTRLVRAAQQARDLLRDVPHAAANGRADVVAEFVDRAMTALTDALASQ